MKETVAAAAAEAKQRPSAEALQKAQVRTLKSKIHGTSTRARPDFLTFIQQQESHRPSPLFFFPMQMLPLDIYLTRYDLELDFSPEPK